MEAEEQPNIPETPEVVEESRKVAYVIKDANFPDLEVCESANAWWTSQPKVEELIRTFKFGTTVKQAIAFVGITKKQWEYFNQVHPEFKWVKENCQGVPSIKALITISEALENGNIKVAMWYLEKRDERFSKDGKDADDDEEWKIPEQPMEDDRPKMTDEQFQVLLSTVINKKQVPQPQT